MLRMALGAILVMASLVVAAGCSSAPRGSNLLSLMAPQRAPSAETADRRDEDTGSPAGRDDARTGDAAPETRGRTLDGVTERLIEEELADLPVHERRQWMAYLQTVDPETVPHILQARRMQIRSSQRAAGDASPSRTDSRASVPPHNAPQTALHSTSEAGADYASRQMDYSTEGEAIRPAGGFRLNAPEPAPARSPRQNVTPLFAQTPNETPTVGYRDAPPSGRFGESPPTSPVGYEQSPDGLPIISPGRPASAGPGGGTGEPRTQANVPPAPLDPAAIPVTASDGYLQEELQRAIALMEAEIAASEVGGSEAERMDYIRRQVWLRMLYFMSRDPQRAQMAIPGIATSEQEFWTELFWALSNYFDAESIPDPAERAALAVAQLASASNHLQEQARLELWNVSFCHDIKSFGHIERYDRDEFRPGQPVLLYAEVRNFHSEPSPSGHFRTRLRSHIEIRRGGIDGERIESNSFAPTEDLCRIPRTDYFHSYSINLPQHLRPGPHALVLTVEDTLSGKIATEVIDFSIR